MKLGAKLRLSYVGIVLLAVSLVLFLIIDNSQRELKEKIGRDLHVAAELEAENIDAYISDKISKLKYFSRDRVLKTSDDAAISQYISQVIKENPAFSEISLVNLSGKTVASTNSKYVGSPFPLHAKGSTELFNETKSSGQVVFTFDYKDKDKTAIEAILFTPIKDEPSSKVISILEASVSMDHILKPVDRYNLQTVKGKIVYPVEHASKMIMTQDGRSQVFTPLVYLQADSDLRGLLKKDRKGYVTFKDPERGAVIAGYADLKEHGTIRGRDWAVISMAPQKEVFSPAVRLRNRMIVLGIIAVAIAWIVAMFVARGISRPVVELANVTDKIAKGDLSQRANIDLSDEVGDLAKSFNKMTDELNSAIASRDQEIIERKNAEEKLKEEIEAKAKFISMISYEFKPSLTTIREGLKLVLDEVSGKLGERPKDLLELAKRSGENLSHLVQDILDFHKLESDREEFNMTKSDINEIVQEVQKAVASLLAEKKEVELFVDSDGKIPKARIDREKIELVLTNIVNIAIRSTQKGSVTIKTAMEGKNAVCVSVKDSGPGIKEEDLPSLFDKYDQPGKAKDKEAGGTGLGLTISKEIITRHGGRIWAESEIGKGTTFNFVIPIEERRK